jgi:hypothetical protein
MVSGDVLGSPSPVTGCSQFVIHGLQLHEVTREGIAAIASGDICCSLLSSMFGEVGMAW